MARTLFLDVDGVLLAPAGTDRSTTDDNIGDAEVPVRLPTGASFVMHLSAVAVDTIRSLPDDIDVRFLTSWLTSERELLALRSQLGLGRVGLANLGADFPTRRALQGRASDRRHFKVRAVVRAIQGGASDVMWVDDGIALGTLRVLPEALLRSLTAVVPRDKVLNAGDAELIRAWAEGSYHRGAAPSRGHFDGLLQAMTPALVE
jgi:hypothetical protein